MNTLVILYADLKSVHMFDKIFDSQCAFEKSLKWACNSADSYDGKAVVLCNDENRDKCQEIAQSFGEKVVLYSRKDWTMQDLFFQMNSFAQDFEAQNILFSWADQPFINVQLTDEVYHTHTEYQAEYTFADGYHSGMSPEMLTRDCTAILSKLAESKVEGQKSVTRNGIFDFIKTDINSFLIETVIGDGDFKMFRIELDCSSKANTLCCKAVYDSGIDNLSPLEFSENISKNPGCLKTVPGYYNIQISEKNNLQRIYEPAEMTGSQLMDLDKFKGLIQKIADFSENAVISLSLWGESTLHPEFADFVNTVLCYSGLSVLVETDGINITEELAEKISDNVKKSVPRTNGQEPLYWLVKIDSVTKETFQTVNQNPEGFDMALKAVDILCKYFKGSVYPQFTRMKTNEHELEQFFRYWSNSEHETGGKVLIQKYDSFCGKLSDLQPADLSPLERNPCWHLRRDLNILWDGSVPMCRECLKSKIMGNVFSDSLKEIWDNSNEELNCHISKNYSSMCGKCDEFYTFNF